MVGYQLNDPSTPDLFIAREMPTLPEVCPSFNVHGYAGNAGGTLERQASGVYFTIATGLNMAYKYAFPPIRSWAHTSKLMVYPRAGRQLNAYYDRSSLKFFYDRDPVVKKFVFTCESADIVAHELGHALLDAMRPDLWTLQALEVFAFHEAFGDICAILTSLSHDEVIYFVLKETNGNLRNENVASKLAEQMGAALYNIANGSNGRSKAAMRNAVNGFTYIQPEKLANTGSDDKLCAECHSFSRVFTGAWYDILCDLYDLYCKELNQLEALKKARDVIGNVLFSAVRVAGLNIRFFDSVARSMVAVADKEVSDVIINVFTKRKIFLRHESSPMARRDVNFSSVQTVHHKNLTSVRVGGIIKVKIEDYGVGDNPLYKCLVDIPNEQYLEYTADGSLVLEINPEKAATVDAARKCLDHINDMDLVSPEGQFSVEDGKLVRNFICSRCKH